jgi:hypothetical protein
MESQRTPRPSLLALGAIAFGPGLLVLYAMLTPLVLAVLFSGRASAGTGFAVGPPDVAALSLITILPPLGSFLAARAAQGAAGWIRLALVIYIGLLPTALAVAFLIAASIAGISMAVVEGVTGGWALKAQELLFALTLLVPMHIIILPWVALASLIIHKMDARPAVAEPPEGR